MVISLGKLVMLKCHGSGFQILKKFIGPPGQCTARDRLLLLSLVRLFAFPLSLFRLEFSCNRPN
jgi:hypothetical protein